MSLNYYSEKIGQIIGLDVKDSECFKALPLDVLIKLLDTLLDTLEASEDNRMVFTPQDRTIFAVQYQGTDRHCQEFFNCPVSAALRYKDVVALYGVAAGAWISTETVNMGPYQPVHT